MCKFSLLLIWADVSNVNLSGQYVEFPDFDFDFPYAIRDQLPRPWCGRDNRENSGDLERM